MIDGLTVLERYAVKINSFRWSLCAERKEKKKKEEKKSSNTKLQKRTLQCGAYLSSLLRVKRDETATKRFGWLVFL